MPGSVTNRFYIEGSRDPRPAAERVIYADGAGAGRLRPGIDVELSHWVPNRTAPEFKADTSTEICLRYASSSTRVDADLVVNDHADVDGFLALYALLDSDPALEHRDVLVDAAGMGDFLAWADRPGFRLSQELSLLLLGSSRPPDGGDCYAAAMKIVAGVLDGSRPESPEVRAGWATIERGCDHIERGDVRVEPVTDHLVAFVYPELEDLRLVTKIPALNAVVDASVWLWPQVRNRAYGERVQLVSAPGPGGWLHDVWAPSYSWAETPDRRPFPGLVSTGDSNQWIVDHEPLRAAVESLRAIEGAPGRWIVAERLTPWNTLTGRAFPVVLSFLAAEADEPAPSSLAPERVAALLAPVWPGR